MNKKTIKIVLTKKLKEWAKSIEDKELSERVLNNSIVTGGCITSMLLGESVNDFDIYIESREVLHDLMKYYTGKLEEVEILDGIYKNKYMSEMLEKDYESGKTISITNLEKDQLKFYIKTGAGIEVISKADAENEKKYEVAYISPNAISLTDDIQIVNRFYGNAEKIHRNYDYVHATNYFMINKGLVLRKKALASILTKTLYYSGSRYPVTSIIRMKKFIKRGWNINAGEMFKMIYQASLLDLTDVNVLEEQLIGVDIAYFDSLIIAIRKLDMKKRTAVFIFEIIDKIFNE